MSKPVLEETEVYIRIPEKGMDFVYSIRRGEEVIESGIVSPIHTPTPKPFDASQQYPGVLARGDFQGLEYWGKPGAAQAFHSFFWPSGS
jgi:hypothetical protein